ncbi:HDOD domain-containing protein [Sulfuricystis multivorans]|uniref:HDOD domain-containing protein n=1 Tax=Sulfuricystis multivorans TaxID=2211108 RepID=UPI0015599B70|nr:HDOD domain-containing protein [Sulfuricystis multivorans]
MDGLNPRTFELAVAANGVVGPGQGLVAAFVPATVNTPAVVALACDPRHDPGRPIEELAPHAIGWLRAELDAAVHDAVWVAIDNYGRFYRATPEFPTTLGAGGTAPRIMFTPFDKGVGIDAFYTEIGAPAEAAIELLTAIVEQPSQNPMTPPMAEFLDAIESHGNLPAPGLIFQKISVAAEEGDARQVASIIQPDPVISTLLINYANAARFAAAGKTASVPQAVTRLGTGFVKRVVFVAEMITRYQKGACPGFDYRGFWMNAVATGAAMRALLPEYGIPASRADDAFTTGLVSGIGWLAVAETYPALMTRYLERCKDADPITKARAQREIFPCEISRVSERYLQRFEFPEAVSAAVAGRSDVDRQWYDILARAIRIGQALSPFECLAIPSTLPVPDACRAEWANWQDFLAAIR